MNRNANLAVVVGMLLWAGPPPAQGQGTIIYHNPEDIRVFSDGVTRYEYDVDLDGNGTTDFTFEAIHHFRLQPTGINQAVATRLGGGELTRYVNPLAENVLISEATIPPAEWIGAEEFFFPQGGSAILYPAFHARADIGTAGVWQSGVNAYIGVRFEIDEALHYGWIKLLIPDTIPDNRRNGGIIEEWAYNAIPNMPILAGQVPEPGTVTLLLAGAGFLAWRFRRVRCST